MRQLRSLRSFAPHLRRESFAQTAVSARPSSGPVILSPVTRGKANVGKGVLGLRTETPAVAAGVDQALPKLRRHDSFFLPALWDTIILVYYQNNLFWFILFWSKLRCLGTVLDYDYDLSVVKSNVVAHGSSMSYSKKWSRSLSLISNYF